MTPFLDLNPVVLIQSSPVMFYGPFVKTRKGHIIEHTATSCPKPLDFTGSCGEEYSPGEVYKVGGGILAWISDVSTVHVVLPVLWKQLHDLDKSLCISGAWFSYFCPTHLTGSVKYRLSNFANSLYLLWWSQSGVQEDSIRTSMYNYF